MLSEKQPPTTRDHRPLTGRRRRSAPGTVVTQLLLVSLVATVTTILNLVALRRGYFDSYVRDRVQLMALLDRHEWDNTWCGVRVLQYPGDLHLYQELAYRIKPDVIIETGTFNGGLTLYLSALLSVINPGGKVVTIDVDLSGWETTQKTLSVPAKDALLGRIVALKGSSTSPDVLRQVAEHVRGARVLVILDSLHTKTHVLEELRLYAPFVSVGSYLIVNDTHHDGLKVRKQPGPMAARTEFLASDDRFVVDYDATKFVVTCAPSGFLKRTK